VAVTPATASVQVGKSMQLTATPKDASGNPLTGRVITWATNNSSVQTLSQSGMAYGVAAGTATDTATSEGQSGLATVTVTTLPPPPPPPPPPGVWPNEPAGLPLVTDWGLDVALPTSGDVPIPGSPGWHVNFNSSVGNQQGWALLGTDASALGSPPGIYDFVYPSGMVQGSAPATVYYPSINVQEIYIGFWWKASNPTELIGAGQKICFEFYPTGNAYMVYTGSGRPGGGHIDIVTSGSNRWTFNVDATDVPFGQWHQVEWYMSRASGALKLWVDGVLKTSVANVSYPGSSFVMFQFSPTWGGVGGVKTETDHYYFDHVHISGR